MVSGNGKIEVQSINRLIMKNLNAAGCYHRHFSQQPSVGVLIKLWMSANQNYRTNKIWCRLANPYPSRWWLQYLVRSRWVSLLRPIRNWKAILSLRPIWNSRADNWCTSSLVGWCANQPTKTAATSALLSWWLTCLQWREMRGAL